MEKLLNNLIEEIINEHINLLNIAIKQRAKFEGWLKIELANKLAEKYEDTRVEHNVSNKFIDIFS